MDAGKREQCLCWFIFNVPTFCHYVACKGCLVLVGLHFNFRELYIKQSRIAVYFWVKMRWQTIRIILEIRLQFQWKSKTKWQMREFCGLVCRHRTPLTFRQWKWNHKEQVLKTTSAVSVISLQTTFRERQSRKFHTFGGLFPCANLEERPLRKTECYSFRFRNTDQPAGDGELEVHSLVPIS